MAASNAKASTPGGTMPRGGRAQALRRGTAAGGLAIAALWPGAASAQAFGQYVYGQLLESNIPLTTETTGRDQSVLERKKPELVSIGLPLGGFRLFPSLLGGVGYTSNVVGAETGKRSDGYVEVNPAVSAQSQWQRHAVNATLSYDGLRYFRTGAKNQDGFLAEVDGRLDILQQDSVFATASYKRFYEDQQEASFPLGGGGAVGVKQPSALVRGVYVVNRARLTASVDYNGFTYENTVSTTGATIDLSYRDRDVYRGSVRAEYLLGQDNSVFAEGTYRRTNYSTNDPLNDRTSNEWRASAGAIADVTNLIRIAGAIGYFRRSYTNPQFKTFGGLAADVRANYYVTPLTTITAIVSRQPEEATIFGSSGYVQTRFGGRVDHELLRNLVPYLSANYSTAKFQGLDRHDRTVDGGGGVDYLLNRAFTFSIDTNYVSRTSRGTEAGPDIPEFRALASIKFRP